MLVSWLMDPSQWNLLALNLALGLPVRCSSGTVRPTVATLVPSCLKVLYSELARRMLPAPV